MNKPEPGQDMYQANDGKWYPRAQMPQNWQQGQQSYSYHLTVHEGYKQVRGVEGGKRMKKGLRNESILLIFRGPQQGMNQPYGYGQSSNPYGQQPYGYGQQPTQVHYVQDRGYGGGSGVGGAGCLAALCAGLLCFDLGACLF
ncbi:hypothetical protein TREMEDRAFT_66137 [Tremella mesenterica DSM 1558]|uniref:uncharacterized protein n=1 Tax=Tremella mesenterica (strain ATCC 24925 / CBS 8224 / DSM 1558 / NBRC 9311 / NRRL Y-6157 / RJB 2259-6 / UBC 559-6) TaxID=578456 RepID=UPI00032CEE16|nr:uncharacterized protein TREMEDRAFT_66137 [Tremella mesenterica DSM 1558]EIW65763.1 hypothetical protein TREMEDRAFT_66137 [Tremella mesenterica DSM 1558]